MKADLVNIIRRKLNWFRESEIEVNLVKKYGDIDKLGISDIDDKKKEEFDIKIIPVIRSSNTVESGEGKNITPIGDNPDTFLEFARLLETDSKDIKNIEIGDRILYKNDEYIVYYHLPVVLGNELVLDQYRAKKVE